MMKKVIGYCMALSVLALSLTGCSGEDAGADSPAVQETTTAPIETAPATTEAPTTEAPTTEAPKTEETTEAPTETTEAEGIGQLDALYGYPHALSFELELASSGISDVTGDPVMGYAITDTGEGYAVTGTITYREYAPVSVAELAVGDSFCTTSDRTYTITAYSSDENGRGAFQLVGTDGSEYAIGNLLSFEMDPITGTPCYSIRDGNGPVTTVLEHASFVIPYGTPEEDWLKDTLHHASYVAGHVYTLTFDENGNVTMYATE